MLECEKAARENVDLPFPSVSRTHVRNPKVIGSARSDTYQASQKSRRGKRQDVSAVFPTARYEPKIDLL